MTAQPVWPTLSAGASRYGPFERIEQGSCARDDFELLADRWNLRSDLADLLAEAGLQTRSPCPGQHPERWPASPVCACWRCLRGLLTFLLLDEPDNHLDASGIDWLSQQLARHRGGYLLVSH